MTEEMKINLGSLLTGITGLNHSQIYLGIIQVVDIVSDGQLTLDDGTSIEWYKIGNSKFVEINDKFFFSCLL